MLNFIAIHLQLYKICKITRVSFLGHSVAVIVAAAAEIVLLFYSVNVDKLFTVRLSGAAAEGSSSTR